MARRARKKTDVKGDNILCCPRLFVRESLAHALAASELFDDVVELSAVPGRLESAPVERVVIAYQSAEDFVAERTADGATPAAALGEWMVVARRIETLVSAHDNKISLLDMALVGSAPSVYAAYLDMPVEAFATVTAPSSADGIDRRLAALFVAEKGESARINDSLAELAVRLVNDPDREDSDATSMLRRYRDLVAMESMHQSAQAEIQKLRSRVETVEAVAQSEREHAQEMNEAIQRELEACHVQQRSLEMRLMSLEEDRDAAFYRASDAERRAYELQAWQDGTIRSITYRVMAPLRRLRAVLK